MKKWTLTVRAYPELKREQRYTVRVIDIRKDVTSNEIEVALEFLKSDQCGRRIKVPLRLPIRPDGLTAEYFRSCYIEVKSQAKISPRDTINSKIIARFEQTADGISWQPIHFEPVSQKEEGEENEPVQL